MSTTLTIGTVDCNDGSSTFLLGMSLGKPIRLAAEYTGPDIDLARLGKIDTSTPVESRFLIMVKAASVDAVFTITHAISDAVANLDSIVVGLEGSSYVGVLRPLLGECVEIPFDNDLDKALINAHWTKIEVIVKREPWIYGAEEILVSTVGYDLPAVVDLSSQSGLSPAPLLVVADAGTVEMSSFWCGVYPKVATIDDFVKVLGSGTTWTGGGSAVQDEASWPGGNLCLYPTPTTDGEVPASWITTPAHPATEHVHAYASKYHVEDDATPHDTIMRYEMDVTQGVDYYVGVNMAVTEWNTAGRFAVGCAWYTEGGSYISADLIHTMDSVTTEDFFFDTLTAPSTAAHAQIYAQWGYPSAGGTCKGTVWGWVFGTVDVWSDNGLATTDIDVSDFEPGEYLVLAKCKATSGVGSATIGHAYGDQIPIPTTELQWLPLGYVTLPTGSVRGTAASTLTISMTGDEDTNYAYLNAVCFLPVSFGGMIGWRAPIALGVPDSTETANVLRWEDDIIYRDDIGDFANAFGARGLKTLGGTLVTIAEQQGSATMTHTHLTIADTPRFEQLPSSGAPAGPGI